MSLEEQQSDDPAELESGVSCGDELAELLDDLVVGREEYPNAPGLVIRPDEVQDALFKLRDEAGFDHLSCATAQEYEDRYESIYHPTKLGDRTDEVSVVVPMSKDNPASQSAEPVFRTVDWHEREAYDLVGTQYEDHPDLCHIFLPETWQGHPLRPDYDQDRPQIATLREHVNPLEEDHRAGDSNTMYINIGPYHPAIHGVLHVEAVVDGEQVVDLESDIGHPHRCEEQMCQQGTYQHQIMSCPDRWDYISPGPLNEQAYTRAVEGLVDIEVLRYTQIIRTTGAELCRIASYMIALGTFAPNVYGDFTAIFMYAMRDHEIVQNILEDLTGQRVMFSYLRLGGAVWDLPEPREEFFEKIRDFMGGFPQVLEGYHDMIASNEILQVRTVGTGVLSPGVTKSYGAIEPVARGSGIDYDLRRDDSYGYYDELEWDVVVEDGCDNFPRLFVRMCEIEESVKIIQQCADLLEDWPEDEWNIQVNVSRTLEPDEDTEIHCVVEGVKGELGICIRADGTDKPVRFKIWSPCFSSLRTLPEISEGEHTLDMIASLGSLGIVLGEVNR